jgi:hypothetical protein
MSKEIVKAAPRAVTAHTPESTGNASLDNHQDLTKRERDYVHVDNLAIVSGGWKDSAGTPHVSRDGTLYISDMEGRAAGLAAILKANGGKHLTIAMPSNNFDHVYKQTYRKESRSSLEAFGDVTGITTLTQAPGARAGTPAIRTFYAAGTPEFEKLRADCKVTTSITFILADYNAAGDIVYPWPDSVGTYRLRTTSEHSAENLKSCLKMIAKFNGGEFAGIPLTVRLTYPNKTDPSGAKQKPPVFVFAVKAPAGAMLTSKTLPLLAAGARDAIGMSLPALPPGETIDDVILEVEAAYMNALTTGLNPEKARAIYFAIVDGTWMDNDTDRAVFIGFHTNGATKSLATFLTSATPESADAMLEDLRGYVVDMEPTGEVHDATTREPIDVEVMTPAPDLATPAEQSELWAAFQAAFGDEAKTRLRKRLDHYGASGSADLTGEQARKSTRQALALVAKEAA